MVKGIIRSLIFAAVTLGFVYAGTTGKISGRIIDADAGTPLPGVNVLIPGTTLGAASDMDGNFVILNLPPGVYNLQASSIGYANYSVIGVRVEIDLTARQNFYMRSEALQGEEVVVTAVVPVIRRDVSASQWSVSAAQIAALPSNDIGGVLSLEAGITSGLSVRGSSADEILFLVDGVPMRDQRNNSPLTDLPLASVKEISVQTGGFRAEYNNVRAAVINVVTKEGPREHYNFSFSAEYSPAAPKNFGISPFDEQAFWLRPYLDPAVAWTGTENGEPWTDINANGIAETGEFTDLNHDGEWTHWDRYDKRQYTEFEGWIAVSERTLSDDDPENDLSPAAAQKQFRWEHRLNGYITEPDYNYDIGFGGPVPVVGTMLGNLRFYASAKSERSMYLIPTNESGLSKNLLNVKVNADLSSTMKLTLTNWYNVIEATSASRVGYSSYMNSPTGIAATVDRIGHTLSWRLYTDEYWAKTRITGNVMSARLTNQVSSNTYWNFLVYRSAKLYRTGPGDVRDRTQLYEITPGDSLTEAPYGFESEPLFAIGDGMGMGGSVSTSRDSSKFASLSLKYDLVSQISSMHEIGLGGEFLIDQFKLKYGQKNLALPDGNTWTEFERSPMRLMAYMQDKIEANGFIANLGINMDVIMPNGDWYDLDSPYAENFFSASFSPDQEDEIPMKKAETKVYFSPRLGISHPVTDNSKLYFNYSHNRQMPTAEMMYKVQRNPLDSKLIRIGDPALPLAKTIAYELGFDRAFGDYLLHLTAYYKDISDQQDWTRYINIKGNVNYRMLTNNSYEDIRGFEAEISKTMGRWVKGALNYEYRINSSGYFSIPTYYQNPSEQRDYLRDYPPVESRPLPTPRFKGYLTLDTPDKFGPQIVGINPFGGWTANIIGFWTRGSYLTWNPNGVKALANNLRWKPYKNADLRAAKTIAVGPLNATFFVDVSNLFNFKDFSGEAFYNTFDYNDYMYSLHLDESDMQKMTSGDKVYPGIPGDDQPGDVRDEDWEFIPIVWTGNIENYSTPADIRYDREWYVYDAATERYMQRTSEGSWEEADSKRVKQVLDAKAYIDMPNQTYFTFLNPRDIYFGINLSFDLN